MKLQGIRVIDLSSFLPGPYLTLAMADHGAEVIKVEAPGGDHGRSIGPLDGDSSGRWAEHSDRLGGSAGWIFCPVGSERDGAFVQASGRTTSGRATRRAK